MTYKIDGHNVRIPEKELEKNMKILGMTREEAIQQWLEDEGYLDNEEQNELESKAKKNRITAAIHEAKAETAVKSEAPKKRRTVKENPVKVEIIAKIAEFLPNNIENCLNVEVLNKNKLISFEINGEKYELDLRQKRKPKEKE